MYRYGTRSKEKLATCHPLLEQLAYKVLLVSPYDITIVHGFRGQLVQDALYDSNLSKKRFPFSRHNKSEDKKLQDRLHVSDALDFAPYVKKDIAWLDTHIFAVVAGCFLSQAKVMGVKLRWGGDWDSDGSTQDQSLMDWGHIEIDWSDDA